jgi:hypothetical protein
MRMDKKEGDMCFDITSTRDEQTDKLLNGDIDWKGRWTEIKQIARQLVTSLSSTIHQNPRAHEYYPVFIKDWAPIEVMGVTSSSIYYRDSRPHASGYESDTRSYKTYDSKRSNYREDRDKRRSKGTHRPSSRSQHPPTSEEVKNWYKQGGTCMFCGDKKHHRNL